MGGSEKQHATFEQREADLQEREASVASREAAISARLEAVQKILDAAVARDAASDVRDAAAVARENDLDLTELLAPDGEYGAGWHLRRNAALDRLDARDDRAAAHSDLVALSHAVT